MLIDEHEGTRISGHDTICGTIRTIYDKLVVGLAETNPELLTEIRPLCDKALCYAKKMNEKMAEHKLKGLDLFPGGNETEDLSLRRERMRLVEMIEDNKRDIRAYQQGESLVERAKR